MAEGLLRTYLAEAGLPASVGSAGLLPGGCPATSEAVAVMAALGVDISRHRSRTLNPQIAGATPLVIGMTRNHVREACVTYGASIERTFTLKELVRRGEQAGPRRPGESVFDWLTRVGAGRQTAELMGDDPGDDVADPVGKPRPVYERTVAELSELLRRFVSLIVGTAGGRPAPPPATVGPAPGPPGNGRPPGDDPSRRPADDTGPRHLAGSSRPRHLADSYGGRSGDRRR